jgi:hypothetical protein
MIKDMKRDHQFLSIKKNWKRHRSKLVEILRRFSINTVFITFYNENGTLSILQEKIQNIKKELTPTHLLEL